MSAKAPILGGVLLFVLLALGIGTLMSRHHPPAEPSPTSITTPPEIDSTPSPEPSPPVSLPTPPPSHPPHPLPHVPPPHETPQFPEEAGCEVLQCERCHMARVYSVRSNTPATWSYCVGLEPLRDGPPPGWAY